MSFGFSPNDLVELGKAVKSSYDGWKSAPEDLADIKSQIHDFDAVISQLQTKRSKNDEASEAETSPEQKQDCQAIIRGCNKTVSDLKKIMDKYSDLGSSIRRHWDRIRPGTKRDEIQKLQNWLAAHINTLGTFLTADNTLTLERVEQRLVVRDKQELVLLRTEIRSLMIFWP